MITLLATDAGVEVSASRAGSASSAQGRPLSAGQPGRPARLNVLPRTRALACSYKTTAATKAAEHGQRR